MGLVLELRGGAVRAAYQYETVVWWYGCCYCNWCARLVACGLLVQEVCQVCGMDVASARSVPEGGYLCFASRLDPGTVQERTCKYFFKIHSLITLEDIVWVLHNAALVTIY